VDVALFVGQAVKKMRCRVEGDGFGDDVLAL
jgi:hypothetical protein